MNCCPNCFHDNEIIGFILTNSTHVGKCDFCDSENIKIIDSRELEETFQILISLFDVPESIGLKPDDGQDIYTIFSSYWRIFRLSIPERVILLIDNILLTTKQNTPVLFERALIIKPIHSGDAFANQHQLRWDKLTEEIKSKNRFFLQETIDLNLLKELLSCLSTTYNRGKIFYRARISTQKGFPCEEMGKPPADKASPGRANPVGIAYLYVSLDKETTFYESRSSHLDYITIAEFKLTETLNVISLKEIYSTVSPFILGENLEKFLLHQKYLQRLESELSKPVRRFDKELDYLPSQYLCEYVKSLGYDAIEYSSSLHIGGVNLAIFSDSKLSCRSAQVYVVDSIALNYSQLEKTNL